MKIKTALSAEPKKAAAPLIRDDCFFILIGIILSTYRLLLKFIITAPV